ncbi:MAG: hypothetical protein IJ310_05735 [Clostridia bacterium]|nr:hypothetical protein [Clostridiales bacterium]MBQ7918287.1 hypothetical protein [Clostridia bacterium]
MDKQRYIIKPSTFAYDGMNTIEEILGEYNGYLGVLDSNDLKKEYIERSREFSSSPTIFNVRMFLRVKEKMLERGFNLETMEIEQGESKSL